MLTGQLFLIMLAAALLSQKSKDAMGQAPGIRFSGATE
jgi:hypothetical protein